MSTIVTIRPASIVQYTRATLTGAADRAAAVNDNSDSSYDGLFNQAGQTTSSFVNPAVGTPTIPAGTVIVSITPRIRINHQNNTESGFLYTNIRVGGLSGPGTGKEYITTGFEGTSGFNTVSGVRHTAQPDGTPWTLAAVSSLYFECGRDVASSSSPGWGTALLVSEMYIDVEVNYTPTATGAGPNANSVVSRPTFSHTFSDTDGDTQQQFRYKVYSSDQYTAAGFDPNTTTPAVDSGWLISASTTWTCTSDLSNGVTYRAFIFVNDGYQNSVATTAGPYAFTTIAISPPGVPAMSVTNNQTNKSNVLSLNGRENMLAEDSADFENSIGNWITGSATTTVNRSTTQAKNGTYSLTMTAASSGQLLAASNATTFLDNYVVVGRTYSAMIWGRSSTTNNICRLRIQWYDASNTLLSSVVGYDMTLLTTRWCPVITTGVAPANAVTARLLIEIDSASTGNLFYFDQALLVPFSINLLDNPLQQDLDSSTFADQWTPYAAGGSINSQSIDTSLGNVIGGTNSQKIIWTSTATYIGESQQQDYLKAGQSYTMSAWVKTLTSTTINLYAAISTNPQSNTVVAANTWTRVSLTFTPTSDVTSAYSLYVRADGTVANTLWIGHVQLEVGSTVGPEASNPHAWSRGGLIPLSRFEVQRSYDQVTWTTITRLFYGSLSPSEADYRNVNYDDRGQAFTVIDYEAKLGVVVYYRLRSTAVVGSSTIVSQWSLWQTAPALTLDPNKWYLKVPEAPLVNYAFGMKGPDWKRKRPESAAFFNPISHNRKIKIRDVIYGDEFSMTASCISSADIAAFSAIRKLQRTMLLQACDGRQWYCEFDTEVDHDEIVSDPNVPYQEIAAGYVEVDAP